MVECMFFDVRYRIHLDIVWLHGYGPHSISVSLSPFFSNTCAQSISYMYMLIHSKGMVYCTLSIRCVLLNCLIKLKLVILVYSFSYNDWITSSTCYKCLYMYVYFMNGKFQCAFLQNGSRIMIGAPGAFYWQGN